MSYNSLGRVPYTTITSNNPEYAWDYSCCGLAGKLSTLLIGKTLKKIYVGLNGYLEGVKKEENFYDFSYMGGTVLMIFNDNIALELNIRAEGMIAHRIHKVSDLSFCSTVDYPPADMVSSENYFYDLKEEFAISFELTKVVNIKVDGTNAYPFSAKDFDEEKANLSMYQNDLPASIHFYLDNNANLSLVGDAIEYFNMYLEQI